MFCFFTEPFNLLTGLKSVFSRATCCTDSREIWHGQGACGTLGRAKFHANWCPGWEHSPQNGKKFDFLVKSCPAWVNPLTDFFYNWRALWKNRIYWYISFFRPSPINTQSCSVSDVLFTGRWGVSDFNVLKYY